MRTLRQFVSTVRPRPRREPYLLTETLPGEQAQVDWAYVGKIAFPGGERAIPIGDFHRLPGDTPQLDTNLRGDELILAVDVPPLPVARRSHYLKVRDRTSYAFALVSVAAALAVDGEGMIRDARLALGGVAHKPWRVPAAEQRLVGQRPGDAAWRAAADVMLAGAQPRRDNAFKVELARRSIARALATAGAQA